MDGLDLLNARAALLRAKLAAEAMPNTPPPSNGGPALTPGGLGQAEGTLMTLGNRPLFNEVPDFHPTPGGRPPVTFRAKLRPQRELGSAASVIARTHGEAPTFRNQVRGVLSRLLGTPVGNALLGFHNTWVGRGRGAGGRPPGAGVQPL